MQEMSDNLSVQRPRVLLGITGSVATVKVGYLYWIKRCVDTRTMCQTTQTCRYLYYRYPASFTFS